MGYVHDTSMSLFIPPTLFHCVTGTWGEAAGAVAGTIVKKVNDANQTPIVNIPIIVPSNASALKGSLLKSIEIDFEISGGALTSLDAVVNKVTRGADGADATVAALDFTYDSGHDAAEERVDVDEHKMTLTLDDPLWIDNDEYILVELTVDQAGGGDVIEFLGAVVNYTARI
jgi:hypothetical protein